MKRISVSLGLFILCLYSSSCSWMMGWISEPIALDLNGGPHAIKPPKNLRLIPEKNLHFRIHRRPGRAEITISAPGWRIEGCGFGGSSQEMTIDSVCGVPSQAGHSITLKHSYPSDVKPRFFHVDKRRNRVELH